MYTFCMYRLNTQYRIKDYRAQCSPRHTCTLHMSLFMQLYVWPQASPVLGKQGMKSAFSCLQNHAPYTCALHLRLASQEKGCFGRGEKGMPRDAVEGGGAGNA
ncbi:hypothetical protein LJM37_003202, partial [Serratia marcescens]